MAARSEIQQCGNQGAVSKASADGSFLDAPAPLSPRIAEPKLQTEVGQPSESNPGISILKEIFPEHGEENAPKKPQGLQQLLGTLPSPARANAGQNANHSIPCGPPAHTPMLPMCAPVMPPPPPTAAAPVYMQAPQEHFQPPRMAAQMMPEQPFVSYRERLRAGGRGAFQRAYDAGIVPRGMKQDWNSAQSATQQRDMQQGGYGDSQQMWSGHGQMQQQDYYGAPMPPQYQCMQQVQQVQQPQQGMTMLPQMAVQQPQMMPMAQGEQSPMSMQLQQMQMAQMNQQLQLQLPQMAMSGNATPTASGASTPMSGYSTPIDNEHVRRECMAMLAGALPQTSQGFGECDQAALAAQLQAAASCERYED